MRYGLPPQQPPGRQFPPPDNEWRQRYAMYAARERQLGYEPESFVEYYARFHDAPPRRPLRALDNAIEADLSPMRGEQSIGQFARDAAQPFRDIVEGGSDMVTQAGTLEGTEGAIRFYGALPWAALETVGPALPARGARTAARSASPPSLDPSPPRRSNGMAPANTNEQLILEDDSFVSPEFRRGQVVDFPGNRMVESAAPQVPLTTRGLRDIGNDPRANQRWFDENVTSGRKYGDNITDTIQVNDDWAVNVTYRDGQGRTSIVFNIDGPPGLNQRQLPQRERQRIAMQTFPSAVAAVRHRLINDPNLGDVVTFSGAGPEQADFYEYLVRQLPPGWTGSRTSGNAFRLERTR